jgi:hypothetical protein
MTRPAVATTASASRLDAGEISNPFVFIVGCPRSGTTLLRRMVDAHPLIAITRRETHWIPACFRKRIGITPDGMVTNELISWLMTDERFRFMNVSRTELESLLTAQPALPYADFVSRVFDLYAKREGKRLAGDKTPGYARQLATLHALWPTARFIHLIRDGRDVCLSFLDWAKSPRIVGRFLPWAQDPVASAALFWEWHIRLARRAASRLPPALYYEVRYEALVLQPAQQCASVCTFLDLPFSDRMLLADVSPRKPRPGLDSKHARLPPTSGLRDWRSQMQPEHIQRFESMAGDLLEELGYVRAFPEQSPASRDEVRCFRDAYAGLLPQSEGIWADG